MTSTKIKGVEELRQTWSKIK